MTTFFSKERNTLVSFLFLVLLSFIPYFYNGEDSHIRIHDNLDSNIVWAKIALDTGEFPLHPSTTVEQVQNGIPASSVCGVYDIALVIFKLFGSYWGYVVNKILMVIIAFFGTYYLLKRHVLRKETPLYIHAGVATLFALLPFWSFNISVAGLPLISYAFLNLRNNDKRLINWFIILVYGFYSSLVLIGVFFLMVMCCFWLYDLIKKRTFNKILLGGIVMLSVCYILSHFPLFYQFLIIKDHVSHRVEFDIIDESINSQTIVKYIYKVLIYSNRYSWAPIHVVSLQKYAIIPLMLFALVLMVWKRKIDKRIVGLFTFILFTSIFITVYSIPALSSIKSFLTKILPLNLERITWLQPLCWYIILAISAEFIYLNLKKCIGIASIGTLIISIAFVVQIFNCVKQQEYIKYKDDPTFKDFCAEEQFSDIKKFIGRDVKDYRVINICFHPVVSQYNGLYTLDGYFPDYPLAYKHQFRKVIANELEKSDVTKTYYDKWGSRCYAFSIEFLEESFDPYNGSEHKEIQHLDYDFEALKSLGGEYILSTAKINEVNNPQVSLLKKFDKNDYAHSNWVIYLYKVL